MKGSWSISASGMAASRALNNVIEAGLCLSVPCFLWCCLYSKIDISFMVQNQFSHSVRSNSSWPHGTAACQTSLFWMSSPAPRACSNSCPSSQWCHPTILSSVVPFPSWFQSFSASGSFQMSQLFASVGQSIRVSASISVLPMNTQDWSPLGWTGWIPCSSSDSQESFPIPQFKSINSSMLEMAYFKHITTAKPITKSKDWILSSTCSLCFVLWQEWWRSQANFFKQVCFLE